MFYISVLIIMLKVEYNDLILRKWNIINFVHLVKKIHEST